MKRKVLILVLYILCLIDVQGQQSKKQIMDSYLDHLFQNHKMMGAVSVFFEGKEFYSKTFGYANVDLKRKIDENTKFRIGSISKTYTAVLVIKAIEEGKLQLFDKLSAFYPEIKNADRITIEELLKHRTGIYNFTEMEGENQWSEKYHSEAELIDYFSKNESNFEPGTTFKYSNTNYALLGFILQKVYQKSFAELIEEKIAIPLQLKNTYYSNETDSSKNESISYSIHGKYLQNQQVNFSNHMGGGGLVSTPKEVNQFLTNLFDGKLISNSSLDMMLPKSKGEYGMGIEKSKAELNDIFEHSGRIENYISDYMYFPNERLGIVTLSNASNINISKVMDVLIHLAYGKAPVIPDFNKTKNIDEKEFAKLRGTYFLKDKKLSFTISSDGENLVFQDSRSGQAFIPLNYKRKNFFEYEDLSLLFVPSKGMIKFKQGRSSLNFYKGN